ncbi:MAG: hypothetical protein B7Y43_00100 [Sphingomonas sp. 28-62-20]|uniref:hypothetical protein n=1 Tax=Sphingomonas sp. 28-62-20 TaxID=1970433 RepID=UPI000BDAB03D|nr:MAG: hypothetical protein B7Y43_00100 [Sphingomonas sp. 28-62-20]
MATKIAVRRRKRNLRRPKKQARIGDARAVPQLFRSSSAIGNAWSQSGQTGQPVNLTLANSAYN